MKRLLLLFLVWPFTLAAQTERNSKKKKETTDSLTYYQQALGNYWRNAIDSIRHTDSFQILQNNYDKYKRRSHGYSGFMLFSEIMHSDYRDFNASISQNGFPALNSMTARFGFGFTNKSDRVLFDFGFFVVGLNTKTTKGDESIKTYLINIIQFDMGFDLLQSDFISLYPYAGLGLRASTIEYFKPKQTNPGFTNITNVIVNNQSTDASNTRLGYQAGLGLDLRISKKDQAGKALLFIKAGTNRAVGGDKFKVEGTTYKPGIKQGDWVLALGFKFVGKQ